MFGIGIGLFLAGLVSLKCQGPLEMSVQEIEEKARGLGMVYREEVVVFLDEQKPDNPVPQDSIKTVSIPAGSNLTDVADLLYAKAIITDRDDFLRLAQKQKVTRLIKAGTYNLPVAADLQQVISIITK